MQWPYRIGLKIHVEPESSEEAHHTCGFLVWHRKFLLAYENMLRSLNPRFRCLTIPYWDYFASTTVHSAGRCNSYLSCNQALRDMGGSTGPSQTIDMFGQQIRGRCVRNPMLNNFCERPGGVSTGRCSRCMPRGNWNQPMGDAPLYTTLANQLNQADTYGRLSNTIQATVHST